MLNLQLSYILLNEILDFKNAYSICYGLIMNRQINNRYYKRLYVRHIQYLTVQISKDTR